MNKQTRERLLTMATELVLACRANDVDWRDIAREAVADCTKGSLPGRILDAMDEVSMEHGGVSMNDVRSGGRAEHLHIWRSLAMWALRHHAGMQLKDIGLVLGNRSHSAVCYAVKLAEGWYTVRLPHLKAAIEERIAYHNRIHQQEHEADNAVPR